MFRPTTRYQRLRLIVSSELFYLLFPPDYGDGGLKLETLSLKRELHIVDWADLATLDLSQFDQPGGKSQLATQLFEAIQKIGR
jgi:hypothetical protein